MKIRPIKGLGVPASMELSGEQKRFSFSKEMSYAELEEIHADITKNITTALENKIGYGATVTDANKLFEIESVMQYLENWRNVDMPISMPPPEVESVSYNPDTGYTVMMRMSLPIIPDIKEIEGWFNPGVLSGEGDIVDMQGESFKCHSIHKSDELCMCAYEDRIVEGPVSIGEGSFVGEAYFSEVAYQGEGIGTPISPLDLSGEAGEPGYTSGLLYGKSNKPLMYSIDVYKSLKDTEFVAVSSFPIVNALSNQQGNVPVGAKVKPYAVGRTIQEAVGRLEDSIKAWAGRKEVAVINEHMMIDRWVCIHCGGSVTSYATKQELLNHLMYSHGGNIGTDRYTHPATINVWQRLP